jgi:hypothetical protein
MSSIYKISVMNPCGRMPNGKFRKRLKDNINVETNVKVRGE